MAHALLEKAAQHTAQARAINDEFEGKEMPAEASHQMEGHLAKASDYRKQWNRQQTLADHEGFLAEPQYKHDMGTDGGTPRDLGDTKAGEFLLDSERKDKQQKSFLNFVRKGMSGVAPEVKTDLVEDSTGELLIPVDYAGTIFKEVPREAVIRNLAFVRPTTRNRVEVGSVLIDEAGWGKLETDQGVDPAPDGLGTPPAAKDTIRVWNLNALVKIGIDELDDSDENLEALIRSQLSLKIAEQEDDTFAAGLGDASFQPEGIAGNVSAGGQVPELTGDSVKQLKYRVASNFRRNGVYLANSTAEEGVALLKDDNGNYLLQPSAAADEPPTFFGKRWYTTDGLPDTSAIVFGDLRQGYMIADRKRLTVTRLVEKYAEDGKIGLLFVHRVGGGVIRPTAMAELDITQS